VHARKLGPHDHPRGPHHLAALQLGRIGHRGKCTIPIYPSSHSLDTLDNSSSPILF
jgi:hypothetical protein